MDDVTMDDATPSSDGALVAAVDAPTVLFVCTGNAARSVMAATLLRSHDQLVTIESAGTHSIPGLPMSNRTRAALAAHDVEDKTHLSAQLDDDMAKRATMIAVFEPMHVSYMRKKHPAVADRVASLPRFVRDLADGDSPSLAARIAELQLESHQFEAWEEVVDPAGGDLADFEASAAEINQLICSLLPKLTPEEPSQRAAT